MRVRGEARLMLQRQDRIEEMLRTIADMRMIDLEDPDNEEMAETMRDAIEGLASGRYDGMRPEYNPRDERAVKVGHENPIKWVRETEAKVKGMETQAKDKAMRWNFWVFMVSMWLLVVLSNVRWAGAEDDCGMPTFSVVAAQGGVLCIGEGL